jgi:ribosomal protein S18 acetylase RimI-like enzyme
VDTTPDGELIAAIHAPALAPDAIVAGYPAHLHIDLLERTRGLGFGRLLIERQLAVLLERGVPGVHLEVASDNPNAIAFYEHLGFATLIRRETSVLMGSRLA